MVVGTVHWAYMRMHVLILHTASGNCLTRRLGGVRRVDFIEGKIKTFLDVNLLGGDRKLLWVNPDCGLKTREWSQVAHAHHSIRI